MNESESKPEQDAVRSPLASVFRQSKKPKKLIKIIHPVFILILYTPATLKPEEKKQMRKQLIAFIAAVLITGTIGLSMFVVGTNALANQNGAVASNSSSSTSPAATTGSASANSDQAQIAQLQSLVAQYQAREQQYQTALNNDNSQLAQAATEMQTIQQLLAYLESRGIIQINSQGQITVTAGRFGD